MKMKPCHCRQCKAAHNGKRAKCAVKKAKKSYRQKIRRAGKTGDFDSVPPFAKVDYFG